MQPRVEQPHIPGSVGLSNAYDDHRKALTITDVDNQVVTPISVLQDIHTELKVIHRLLEILTETEITPSDVED